ncbi:tyrosine-protein kinase SYK [Diabrotica virgifera virgifera]|uniref:Protein kinase domain-containing protein n=1 Tax=Diabrotica virgifera virgifera TaxID=50390 RepID=A0ABM5ITJ7_DIAVI|nr:tyrosine-protein kinase SYK [Diabrotica virgifera virgifera]
MAPKNNKRRLKTKSVNRQNTVSQCNVIRTQIIDEDKMKMNTQEGPFPREKLVNQQSDVSQSGITNNQIIDRENNKLKTSNELDYQHDLISKRVEEPHQGKDEAGMKDLEQVEKTEPMKTDKDSVLIMQKILNICNDSNQLKRELLSTFSQYLEDIGDDKCELSFVSKILSEHLLPKELLKLINRKYKITEKRQCGAGGFGVIYLGKLRESGGPRMDVIVKGALPKKEKYLKSEAIILSPMDHKNIVKMISFITEPMEIVMEYMEYGSLDRCLEQREVSEEVLYVMIIDIITGMEYLEKNKIVHRDLVLRNIFVSSKFQCKIGDFGLAVKITRHDGIYKEEVAPISGYHIPPNVLISQEYSKRSDIWAFGLILWQMHYMQDGGLLFVLYGPILDRFRILGELPGIPSLSSEVTSCINKLFNIYLSKRPSCSKIKKHIQNIY